MKPPAPQWPAPKWLDVAPVEGFVAGQARLVETADGAVAVFNLAGAYYAVRDCCTHEESPMLGCGLDPEEVLDGAELICPRHGARFCIRTGEALTPPAYEPLARHAVRLRDGIVQVQSEALPD